MSRKEFNPQTEIVANRSQCGTHGKQWEQADDCIVDKYLYKQLQDWTNWDANNVCQIEKI